MPKKKTPLKQPENGLKKEVKTAIVNLGDISLSIMVDASNHTVAGIVNEGSTAYSFAADLKEM